MNCAHDRSIVDLLSKAPLLLDGAHGTYLLSHGTPPGGLRFVDTLCASAPHLVASMHERYIDAGSRVIQTNSFLCHPLNIPKSSARPGGITLASKAAKIARSVADRMSVGNESVFVTGTVGPPITGPADLSAISSGYQQLIEALIEHGVDMLTIETVRIKTQAKLALDAAQDAFRTLGIVLPLHLSFTLEANGTSADRLTPPQIAQFAMENGVAIVGLNCSSGPQQLASAARKMAPTAKIPLAISPNAGLPKMEMGKLLHPAGPNHFAATMAQLVRDIGPALIGGCCGTTPAHIEALRQALAGPENYLEHKSVLH